MTEVWLIQDQGVLVEPIETYNPPEVILQPQPREARFSIQGQSD